MQEEISQRSVTLIVQTGKMTGKVFLQAIQKYLDILKQQVMGAESPFFKERVNAVRADSDFSAQRPDIHFPKAGAIADNETPSASVPVAPAPHVRLIAGPPVKMHPQWAS